MSRTARLIMIAADAVLLLDVIKTAAYIWKMKRIISRTNEFCRRNGG